MGKQANEGPKTTEKVNAYLMAMRRYKGAYAGWPYLIVFILLLTLEVLIAFNYYPAFVRAYLGDVLVIILIYALIRGFYDLKTPWLPWGIFTFATLVEFSQLLGLATWLGADAGSFWALLLGATFDWWDLLAYLVGTGVCALILDVEIHHIRPWWQRCLAWVREQ